MSDNILKLPTLVTLIILCLYHKQVCNSEVALDNKISSEKALEDISIIRSTIDGSMQGALIEKFIMGMGKFFIISGVLLFFMSIYTYYSNIFDSGFFLKKYIIRGWIALFIILAIYKSFGLKKLATAEGKSLFKFISYFFHGTFIKLDLPLEISAVVLLILFIKSGMLNIIPALLALFSGLFYTIMGVVFHSSKFTFAGYIYIFLGTIGMLFFENYPLQFSAFSFGIVLSIFGILIVAFEKR